MISALNQLVDLVEEHLDEDRCQRMGRNAGHHRVPPAPDVLVAGRHAPVGVRAPTSHDRCRRCRRQQPRRPAGHRRAVRLRLDRDAARVPLIHRGVNPHIQRQIAALPPDEHRRLTAIGNTEPAGLLAVSDDLDPDRAEGSELTYLHGVAVTRDTPAPDGLDTLEIPAGGWAEIVAMLERADDFSTATSELWLPVEPT